MKNRPDIFAIWRAPCDNIDVKNFESVWCSDIEIRDEGNGIPLIVPVKTGGGLSGFGCRKGRFVAVWRICFVRIGLARGACGRWVGMK